VVLFGDGILLVSVLLVLFTSFDIMIFVLLGVKLFHRIYLISRDGISHGSSGQTFDY